MYCEVKVVLDGVLQKLSRRNLRVGANLGSVTAGDILTYAAGGVRSMHEFSPKS